MIQLRWSDIGQNIAVVEYDYDAFGNTINIMTRDYPNTSRHIVHQNPWRWKGYYFDLDTDFYIIDNENYDPKFGRYLNPIDYNGLLERPWLSPYVAFNNNFVMAEINPHNFNAYFLMGNELNEQGRSG